MREKPSESSGVVVATMVVVVLVVLYFGIFGALIVDELVLRSFLFSNYSPDWLQATFRVVYWPLIWLMRVLGFVG